jgi:L-fuconolactonase
MTIDSHVHFWKYDKKLYPWIDAGMKTLRADYLPDHIRLNLKRNGIEGCIAVQAAESEYETRFLSELAASNDLIKGVVGWLDLKAPNIRQKLEEFRVYQPIVGYRHIVQSEPDDFLYNADFRRGVRLLKEFNYSYDILIFPRQLKAAIDFVSAFPEHRFILDHCAKPSVKTGEIDEWAAGIKELAKAPNVYCKVSGLVTEAKWREWSAGDFYPYLDVVFENFGTDRLLFGSDWPVMLLSGIYVQWKSLVEKYLEKFPEEEKEKVFGLNAVRAYNLQVEA